MPNSIDCFISEYNDLESYLLEQQQASALVQLKNHYRKVLLLSCASYYETRILKMLFDFTSKVSSDERLISFLKNKAIERQYHTFFNWEGKNINSFLGLFGNDFKSKISNEIQTNQTLSEQMKAFLTIGNERNLMVHENFMEYKLEKTFEEILSLHKQAMEFIAYLEKAFEIVAVS